MVASELVPVVAGVLVFVAVVLGAAAFGGLLLWRVGRRRWRAFRSHGLVVGALALWEATAAVRVGRWTDRPLSPRDQRPWTPRATRRALWRSISAAESAVRAADDVGAPTAELPSLCRRLRTTALDLDTVLRVETAPGISAEVRAQVGDVLRAAADIRQAAMASASDVSGARVRELVRDADHELQCLSAGLASARASLPDPRS